MKDSQHAKPKLIFFRDTPKDMITRPPLASSLQHLETSFLLIAIGRYPDALVTCGSAIESSIKAAINASPDDHLDFRRLIKEAEKQFPSFTSISRGDIKNLREKRNEIIHYGFSPKDDDISAMFLLKTGYILIEQCYKSFFQFSLHGEGDTSGGLDTGIDHHLRIARKVYKKAEKKRGLNLRYCFIGFAHTIRWGIQHWMMSDWQKDLLDSNEESAGTSWELQDKQKNELRDIFDVSWDFECPVCGESDSFICEIDGNKLNNREVFLKRGACAHCNFVIPENCPFLADELCAEQLNQAKLRILDDYGIT